MTGTSEIRPTSAETLAHVLAVDIVGRATASADDLSRSLAILSEIAVTCETYEQAKKEGLLVTVPLPGGLILLFLGEPTTSVQCALELYETIRELPSMSVIMALHSGSVGVAADESGAFRAVGDGVEVTRALIEGGHPGQILLSESYAASLEQDETFASQIVEENDTTSGASPEKRYRIEPQKLFIIEREDSAGVHHALASALSDDGHEISGEGHSKSGIEWAKSLESRIRSADTVVAIVSDLNDDSDLVQFQLEIAIDERRKRGKPQIVPVWAKEGPTPDGPLAALNRNLHHAVWAGAEDNDRVISEVRAVLASGQTEIDTERLDSVRPVSAGGAVSSDSKFYVERPADKEFEEALRAHESIILVKGPRQSGKTSLIGRGVRFAEDLGWRCTTTDFQNLSSRQLQSEDHFYRVVAATLNLELGFDYDFDRDWIDTFGSNLNMGRFLRSLVASSEQPLVWFMDEADRLFTAPFASGFFGLVRSWHNARATDRRGPWPRLTIVIGYATEAHLFIEDLNQSPFNVGCEVELTMFTLENTQDLNARYGNPIADPSDVQALYALINGQPFLTRRAFDVLIRNKMDVATLLATAHREDGPFGDHLKRTLASVSQLPFVWDALKKSLAAPNLPDSDGLHRLVAAGLLVRKSERGYQLSCELYRRFLAHYLEAE